METDKVRHVPDPDRDALKHEQSDEARHVPPAKDEPAGDERAERKD